MNSSDNKKLPIDFLYGVAAQLGTGEHLQVTKLLKIFPLIQSYEQMQKFLIGMLYYIEENPRVPVNPYPVASVDKKRQMIRALLDVLQMNIPDKEVAKTLEDEIFGFCAGHRRWSTHSSGFKFADADLLMMWRTARGIHNGWGEKYLSYAVAQAFCCDYKNMRYFLDQKSAERVRWIADYFSAS